MASPEETQTEVVSQTILFDTGGQDDILATLADFFDFPKDEIEEHTRRQPVTQARQMIMYLLRKYGDMSFPAIGRLIGNRDHTTVIHAYNKTKKEVADNPALLEPLAGPIALAEALKARKLRVKQELQEMNAKLYAEAVQSIRLTPAERRGPQVRTIAERDLKVLEMYREGLTLQNMADLFELSRERIRQIVLNTIQYLAINESITKGIVMDMDVLLEEETKKRKTAQDSKKPVKVKAEKVNRWSRYYDSCRECNSTVFKHTKQGLCERCSGAYRGETREKIIAEHSGKCDTCHMSRPQVIRTYGRDFYITKEQSVLCKKDFLSFSAQKMGHYKNFEWSRHHAACKKCGTTTVPHSKNGLCENCSGYVSPEQREASIISKGSKCDQCGMSRANARKKFHADLRLTKGKETLCLGCFQKYIRSKQ